MADPHAAAQPEFPVEDATDAMRAWADLCDFGMRMALSTEHGTPEEIEAAWEAWVRGLERENRERDLAWERMAAKPAVK
ncbi:MAG: hypothetical protein HYY18_00030 [Planctomycetes bacterium]|nr:hypothetical protein [Planctomycetota bacterium]